MSGLLGGMSDSLHTTNCIVRDRITVGPTRVPVLHERGAVNGNPLFASAGAGDEKSPVPVGEGL